ncbi:MAG: 4Fe-4S binding protein [Candidatus Bathyarchaeia archaeon]|nr:4Fe-4S binding protein [Candidatus Brockarchaeota archaeon]MBS7606185.1 4Fe-4S binding protein [Candidatus Bathyarchaeota archaeon]
MKARLELKYSPAHVNKPILSKAILEARIPINILKASLTASEGLMTIEMDADKETIARVIEILKSNGVQVKEIPRYVEINTEKCIDCGACTGVCPTDALTLDSDKKLSVREEKCILCGNCLKACPRGAVILYK